MTQKTRQPVNTTCEIYAREIEDMILSKDISSVSRMIHTWYTRCRFKTAPNNCELLEAGVRDNGDIWLLTTSGLLEFRPEKDRWRLIEHESEPMYMMARIAEITQVPFGYLCGIRDAVSVIESSETKSLSERIKSLRDENRKLETQLRRKRIAVDAVVASVSVDAHGADVCQSRYPDPPSATWSWAEVRDHFRNTPGVYFAWEKNKIVYVGATQVGMHGRLSSGHERCTPVDRFSFVEVPVNEVYFAETCYVARFAPERNACVAEANGKRTGGLRGKRKE